MKKKPKRIVGILKPPPKPKRPKLDASQLAKRIVDEATGQVDEKLHN